MIENKRKKNYSINKNMNTAPNKNYNKNKRTYNNKYNSKYNNTENSEHKNHVKRNYRETNPKKEKIKELTETYGMEEYVAVQIISGYITLETWLEKEKKKAEKKTKLENFQERVRKFSNRAIFSPQASVSILESCLTLKEYKEQKFINLEIDQKSEKLANEKNIPFHIAKMIVNGRFTFEDYLAREEEKKIRKEKALAINKEHPEISLGSCYKIVDKKLSIEEYLERVEKNKNKRREWYRNYLKEHKEDNKTLGNYLKKLQGSESDIILCLFGKNSDVGTVDSYTPYDIKIKDKEGKIVAYSKLDIKFFCRYSYSDTCFARIELNQNVSDNPVLPSNNPTERYQIPKELMEQDKILKLTLGDGEILQGKIKWFSKYDLKLLISSYPKASVIVFRHAVISAEEVII